MVSTRLFSSPYGPLVLILTVISNESLRIADTRTKDHLSLGHALLQHQQAGVLPSSTNEDAHKSEGKPLPLLDPLNSLSMPPSWVRAAILVRINSLIRGHSGVRWELLERMSSLLSEHVTPLVPLRSSISASGGSSPILSDTNNSNLIIFTKIYRHCRI